MLPWLQGNETCSSHSWGVLSDVFPSVLHWSLVSQESPVRTSGLWWRPGASASAALLKLLSGCLSLMFCQLITFGTRSSPLIQSSFVPTVNSFDLLWRGQRVDGLMLLGTISHPNSWHSASVRPPPFSHFPLSLLLSLPYATTFLFSSLVPHCPNPSLSLIPLLSPPN